jgi:hypothetical protein
VRLLDNARPEEMAGLAELIAVKPGISTQSGRLLLTRWGALDGPAALAWLKADHPCRPTTLEFAAVTAGWAARDPAAAMNWIRGADSRAWDVETLFDGALQGWAERDLSALTEFLLHGEPKVTAADHAESLFRTIIAGRGIEGLENWMELLQRSPGTDALLQSVFVCTREMLQTTTDVKSAVTLLRFGAGQSWCKTEDVERLLWSVCDRNPEQVLDTSLQVGPALLTGKYYLAEEAMTDWCERDPAASARWLQSHADSPLYGDCLAAAAAVQAKKETTKR